MPEDERNKINKIDVEIKKLLLMRLESSRAIGAYKYANGIPVFDARREEEVKSRIFEGLTPTEREYMDGIYSAVFEESKKAQLPRYGLLTGHAKGSLSPFIHSLLGNDFYVVYTVKPENLGIFASSGIKGFNVTMPYKQEIMKYLDIISDEAKEVGAVNAVKNENGVLYGCNTDVFGLMDGLERAGMDISGKKVCILGSGGASKAAQYVCKKKNASFVVVSRTGSVNYEDTDKYADSDFLINCTPVGMGKGNTDTPIDIDLFTRLEGVYDVIYTPYVTKLVYNARKKGINAVNGLYMLVSQAVRTHEFFFGTRADAQKAEEIYSRLLSLRPVALVGMPGCGKTTIASLCGEDYEDTDRIIEKSKGKTSEEIIVKESEEVFRRLEEDAVKQVCELNVPVVSLGGGTLTDGESRFLVKSNFRTVWVKRDLDKLSRKSRPLSANIAELYEKRRNFYEESDYVIENNGKIEDAVTELRRIIYENNGNKRT